MYWDLFIVVYCWYMQFNGKNLDMIHSATCIILEPQRDLSSFVWSKLQYFFVDYCVAKNSQIVFFFQVLALLSIIFFCGLRDEEFSDWWFFSPGLTGQVELSAASLVSPSGWEYRNWLSRSCLVFQNMFVVLLVLGFCSFL